MVEAKSKSLSSSETRNGFLRKKLGFFPETVAKFILDRNGDFSPNAITSASAALTTVGSIRGNIGLLAGALSLDFFDGAVAREKNLRNPGSHDTRMGGLLDNLNDRYGSAVMGITRIVAAHRRGDKYGKTAATVATLTAPVPSYLKSRGEMQLQTYPEAGKNPLDFFGTHAGRTLLAIVGTLRPHTTVETPAASIPLPSILDTIASVANLRIIYDRLKPGTPIQAEKAKLEEIKRDAQFRSGPLLAAVLATGAAVAVTHFLLGETPKRARR